MIDDEALDRAVAALEQGELVVYPTETVYGLGAKASDVSAVERVFTAKGRDHSKPISIAFPDIDAVSDYTNPSERERAFMADFLPGPVTVVVQRTPVVPDVLTAGQPRVGVRVPDHADARTLLEQVAPITATSANLSGQPSVRTVEELPRQIREAVAVVLDGGTTPGGGSTVVNVEAGTIHRRGAKADTVEEWLDSQ